MVSGIPVLAWSNLSVLKEDRRDTPAAGSGDSERLQKVPQRAEHLMAHGLHGSFPTFFLNVYHL